MSDAETAVAPNWESWSMDQLEDDEISHCGHLDTRVIVDGCCHCDEIVAHAGHVMTAPVPMCDGCHRWNIAARALADDDRTGARGLTLGGSARYRGEPVTVIDAHRGNDRFGQATTVTAVRAGGRHVTDTSWAFTGPVNDLASAPADAAN